jgi:hypothetical protein
MALRAFQASLNILINYERSYEGFYVYIIFISSCWAETSVLGSNKLQVTKLL